MTTLPQTPENLNLEAIRSAELTNDEIIELIAFFSSAESALPYAEHLRLLNEKYNDEYEMRRLNVEIFSHREKFGIRALGNYFSALGTEGYETLIIDLIRGYQQDKLAGEYLRRLELAFNHQPDEKFVRGLLEFLDTFDQESYSSPGIVHMKSHFQDILDKVASFAPVPKYIREYEINIQDLPELQEKEISGEVPPYLMAQYLINQLDSLNIYIEPGEESPLETLTNYLADMPLEERKNLANLLKADPEEIQALRNNRDIFRVFGPVNPYPDTDYSELKLPSKFVPGPDGELTVIEGQPNVNVIYGGARMFTDMEIDHTEDELPIEDWFSGICEECNLRIRSYHYAVRVPHTAGGWFGCYCSWNCVRKHVEIDNVNDPDEYNMYEIQLALISEYEAQMNEIGIADRDIEQEQGQEEGEEELDEEEVQDLVNKLPKLSIQVPS